eukprot:364705-Chlamydomonas_euryale.AAC.12
MKPLTAARCDACDGDAFAHRFDSRKQTRTPCANISCVMTGQGQQARSSERHDLLRTYVLHALPATLCMFAGDVHRRACQHAAAARSRP